MPAMMARLLLVCVWTLLATAAPSARADGAGEGLTESMRTVTLGRGATLNVIVSRRAGATPTTAALLFAGYPGILRIRLENGQPVYDLAGNFLLRARRHLNTASVFSVLVDCPSDELRACDDSYRSSARHAADIAEVIAFLKRDEGAQKIYLVGTSYGTVSSAYLARALDSRIDGAVHTSTFTDPRNGRNAHGMSMAAFDWSQTAAPQLFVHHRDDPCDLTRYASIVARRGDIPLVTVEGSVQPRGDACQAFSAHGFVGREPAVMRAIAAWIETGKVTARVGE